MLEKLEKLKGRHGKGQRRRRGCNSAQTRDHREKEARRLLKSGLRSAGLRPADFPKLSKRDCRRRVIDRLISKRTVMPVGWNAESLSLGHPNEAASLILHDPAGPPWGNDWKVAGRLPQKLESNEKFD